MKCTQKRARVEKRSVLGWNKSWTRTLRHGDSNTHQIRLCILHVEHPRLAPPKKKTVMSRYVFGWCLCQNYLSFYIWTPTKLLYKQRSMFWIFSSFDIVTIIFCHAFQMLYHVWFCSCHPCKLTIIFFFITNNTIIICFVKWSIITLWRLSKVNQHF